MPMNKLPRDKRIEIQSDLLRSAFRKTNERRLSHAMVVALEKAKPDLDPAGERAAENAIQEAVSVVSFVEFSKMPWIGVSDESIVTLQWQDNDKGVALFFSGGGILGFSTKQGRDAPYMGTYQEGTTQNGLPDAIRSEILRLSKRGG